MGAAFEFSFGGARGEMAEAREVKEVPRPPAPVVAPREGALRLSVVDARGGEPLPGASISVPGRTEAFSEAAGQVLLEGLAPGPWEVKVAAGGFRPEQVAVLVIAGEVTALDVSLAAARQGPVYATLSGQVRSVHKGQPLQAWLVIPEAKVRQRTDARGSFQIQLKQGRYRVILSAPGHLTQTKVITVREGEQAIFNVDLFPKSR
jgi:hypothetical protein